MDGTPTVAQTEITSRAAAAGPRRTLSRCAYRLVFHVLTWLAV